jgi:murein DD-endopeptidase MepM/ murein hydrolase activator NlpD
MQRSSGNSLSAILGVTSFSALSTSIDTIQRISISDTNLLAKLAIEKQEIERIESEIKVELENLELDKQTQETKQQELNTLLGKINTELSTITQQESSVQKEYDNAKAERDAAKAELEKEFAANGGVGDYVGGEWRWPVPTHRYVSSYYGYRNIFGYREFHTGIDIPAPSRTPIIASNSGIVTTAAYAASGYGNRVIVDHGGGYKTLYAHCYSLNVKVGQYVKQGDVIAYVGTTGMSTGNHLHFEIRVNNQYVNPYPYIKGN